MDGTQVLLILVVFVLTAMLGAIGSQFFLILRELKNTISKINKVLDDTGVITESVSKPVNMLSGVVMGIKGGAGIAKLLNNKKIDVQK